MYSTRKLTILYSPSMLFTILSSIAYLLGSISYFIYSNSFDFVFLLIIICFSVVLGLIHYLILMCIFTCSRYLSARFELFVTIKNKDNIFKTVDNIVESRNLNLIRKLANFLATDDIAFIEGKIKDGSLIAYLNEKQYKRKDIKDIESELKIYDFRDDLNDLIRQFESKELIKKQSFSICSVLMTVIGFLLAFLCFFKVDFSVIKMNTQLIISFIYLLTVVACTISDYLMCNISLVENVKLINEIFENESFSYNKNKTGKSKVIR